MFNWKRWLILSGLSIVAFFVLITIASLISANYLVDIWWFDSLGYEFYYWQRLLYRYVIFASVTLLFFLIFFFNFWAASRFLGTTSTPPAKADASARKAYKDILRMFRTGSMWAYTPLSLIISVVIALPLFREWERFLLYVFGSHTGVSDPAYGKDISYFLFSFPIYTLLQRRLLIAFSILLLGLLFLYWLERRLLLQQDQTPPRGARWHLNILVLLVFSIEIWNFVLQRYDLLFNTEHEPLFFGPGYVEMNVILPLIWIVIGLLTATALSLVYFINTRKGLKIFAAATALLLLALGARYSPFLPDLVFKYWVRPNAISKERPYIENSIKSTLTAYNLNHVEIRDFEPERIPSDIEEPKIQEVMRNIPVWDGELLNGVYEQLQELRTYYDFATVDVMHYNVNGRNQQVFLAARELNLEELAEGARSWINDHMVYTHGYGAVMTPAGQGGDEPMTWFLRGIPLESEFGFTVEQPAIYYGILDRYSYVIAPNDIGEFAYPKGSSNMTMNYDGIGGVPISSFFKKLMFAYYLGDRNIFFTAKTNEKSKIHFRRNIRERIKILAPYLRMDQDPYLVVTPKRLFWFQDAYTTSDGYPYAERRLTNDGEQINYIRNSVKIAVDAYNGTTDFYISDPSDPIILAYSRMYPGLFKSMEQMPPELLSQVRYPQDYFNIQMSIYAKYHQTDPEVFYQQEDEWEFAEATLTLKDSGPGSLKSYYLTLDLIEPGRFDFLLLAPMTPKGRANLRALTMVGSDRGSYGKLIIYSFPKGELVYGPSQIYALINQDTQVAQQLTLWDQAGSQVERGKMIILPIGRVVIYIQPVYLKSATTLKIPELKRLIMTQGQMVVMEPTLEDAYDKLSQRLKAESQRLDKRFAPLESHPPGSHKTESPPGQLPSEKPTPPAEAPSGDKPESGAVHPNNEAD